MGPIKNTKQQLHEERCRNMALTAQLEQTSAILAYVAMMADVEIPVDEEENSDE